MAKYKVYVTDERHESYEIERQILKQIDAELIVCNCLTEDDILANCAEADALLLDCAPGTAKVIAGLPKCKVINRYGVGYDNVDLAAANAAHIQVTYVPDYCEEDVSDHAMGLMMACMRDIANRDRLIRQGKWNLQRTSFRIQGKVLGLIGFGRIARAFARKCGGFGLEKILVYDPYVTEEACQAAGAQKATLEEVMRQADILSLHAPVTPETTRMLNKETIAWMKPTAILVNTSRGMLIDDEALIEALRQRRILCAGLDAFSVEPMPKDSPYFELDNVILTDHSGYSNVESIVELKEKSAWNIVDVLTGKQPKYPVNRLV